MEYVVQAFKVLKNLVHAKANQSVPECVKRIRLTESFRQIYALVSLARIFQL